MQYHATVQGLIDEKKQLLVSTLIVIGIGGSNLGIQAVQEALGGILYNETNPLLKVYYADTVDAEYIKTLLSLAQRELEKEESYSHQCYYQVGDNNRNDSKF